MKMVLFFSVLIMALFYQRAEIKAEFPPCGCYPQYRTQKIYDIVNGNRDTLIAMNQDSSMVLDTCRFGPETAGKICGDKLFYSQNGYSGLYDKKHFRIEFLIDAIKLNKFPEDAIVYVQWQNIDTIYTNLRSVFSNLEQKYGEYKFLKIYPSLTNDQKFDLEFEDYINVYELIDTLKNIPNLKSDYPAYHLVIFSDVENDDDNTNNISPNPVSDFISLNFKEYKGIIEIFTLKGIFVKEMLYQQKIDLSFLSTGIYFLKADNKFYKFIKK